MTLRSLFLLLLAPALIAAFAACSGDDDGGQATDQPEVTDVAGDDGDDTGDDGDDGGNGDGAPADSRGSGTVVVGDQTFEVAVDTCILDESDSIIIAGTSSTADGQSVYVSVESLDSPHTLANAAVGVGSTSLFDLERGDHHYGAAGYTADADFIPPYVTDPDLVVETNGENHISFTATFNDRQDSLFSAPGSVDVTCQ